jgi:hypothetical protein
MFSYQNYLFADADADIKMFSYQRIKSFADADIKKFSYQQTVHKVFMKI